MSKAKTLRYHSIFRVGDVVKHEGKIHVVSGTQGWIHNRFTNEDGVPDKHISLAREIGATSLLTVESRCTLVHKRERIAKMKRGWWSFFIDGEK